MRSRKIDFVVKWCLFYLFVMVDGKKNGPYKVSMHRAAVCPSDKTTQPVDQNPPSALSLETYIVNNVTLVRGNITAFREHRIKKMKAVGHNWEKNNWKAIFQMSNMGCNRVFFPAICSVTGLKYDVKTCTIYKGFYPFSGFNMNKIQHTYMATSDYGKQLWRMEIFSPAGSVICYEFEVLIEPDK